MKFWAYFLIPVYTVLFTRGYNWFTTNFSVIGNFFDKKRSFFLWGVLVGSFFYIIHRKVKSRLTLNPVCGRMVPAALALLFFAITTPYLPEELPLKSVLHIIFAFLSALLVLLFLLLVIWLPEVPIWLAGHCGRVRAASGGSRDHKQRTGDICDTDIGGHG